MTAKILTPCLALVCCLATAAAAGVPRSSAATALSGETASAPPTGEAPLQLALTFGDPVPLTQGEKASIRFLMPDVDPEAFPPETWGAVRGVLLSNDFDSEKRLQLKALLP
ncbi:hypothetical protein [Salipiger bermudensis]|uniref:hypothetical protein n=1 Tax=Salipiger bermudensis TaxID=344736 RepID=UPI001CD7C53E|nr:hypothetical protein [Salipiger bermudensis]MCA0960871.1 hypothetical protein [Salipiger bermudensis]